MTRPFLFLCLPAVLLVGCGSHPARPAAADAKRPVIFIGLDGADWQLLDDYTANGTMPNLARLVREGTRRLARRCRRSSGRR